MAKKIFAYLWERADVSTQEVPGTVCFSVSVNKRSNLFFRAKSCSFFSEKYIIIENEYGENTRFYIFFLVLSYVLLFTRVSVFLQKTLAASLQIRSTLMTIIGP